MQTLNHHVKMKKNIRQDENIPPQSPPNQLLSARYTNSQLTTINSQLTTNNSQLTTNNSHSSRPTTINKQTNKQINELPPSGRTRGCLVEGSQAWIEGPPEWV